MTRRSQVRRRPIVEELEARILYSADIAPITPDLALPGSLVEQRVVASNGEYDAHADSLHAAQPRSQELVFVDETVDNSESLIAQIGVADRSSRDLEIVRIGRNEDGLAVITDALAERDGVSAIHIFSHGRDGVVRLGNIELNVDTLVDNVARIRQWSDALGNDADILLYGCDVAKSESGQRLVDALSQVTGADIAASEDKTGGARQADWDLEFRTGAVDALAVIEPASLIWDGILATPDTVVTGPPALVTPPSDTPSVQQAQSALTALPLAFEENAGQFNAPFEFVARGSGYAVGLDSGDAAISLGENGANDVLRLQLIGRNAQPFALATDTDIVELQLERLRARLAERGIELELTDAAKESLAEAGWDPTYGARPLKRALQRMVENPLAMRLLEGDFADGDRVRVDAQNGELVFEKAPAAAPAAV
jgi:hypothetical protein